MITWPKPEEYGYDMNGFKKSRQNIVINQLLKESDESQSKIKTWAQLLQEGLENRDQEYLKGIIRDGIPDKMRKNVWPQLIHSTSLNYTEILETPADQKYLRTIGLDIGRTFPNNIFFAKNQFCYQGLKNVLRALSNVFPQIGYCQGLNYIVATILLRVPEEEAFNLSYHILRNLGHGKLLINLMNIEVDLYVLDCLVEKHFKKFNQHLSKHNLKSIEYASSWFITLYCGCLPFEYNLRIMELYLTEGKKILYRVALAILKLKKRKAKEMNSFEDTLMFLKNFDDFRDVPASDFVKEMFSFNVSRKEIEGYEEVFRAKK